MKKLILFSILIAALCSTQAQSTLKPLPTSVGVSQKMPTNMYRVRYWDNSGLHKLECISFHSFGGVTTLLVIENGKLKRKELATAAILGAVNLKTNKHVAL